MIGCAQLLNSIPFDGLVDTQPLLELGQKVVQGIWSEINTYASIQDCKELKWLGMAHGWAGILYATLQWSQAIGASPALEVQERLWELASLAEPKGRGICWRRSPGDPMSWTGWCHGTAGYVHLWTLAYKAYGDSSFLDLAEKSAWHTWTELNRNCSNLCCGLAGQSYALLNIYKYTRDKEWLERARIIGEKAILDITSPRLRSHSLYKGDVGIALLTADLSNPEYACMPLFELD